MIVQNTFDFRLPLVVIDINLTANPIFLILLWNAKATNIQVLHKRWNSCQNDEERKSYSAMNSQYAQLLGGCYLMDTTQLWCSAGCYLMDTTQLWKIVPQKSRWEQYRTCFLQILYHYA